MKYFTLLFTAFALQICIAQDTIFTKSHDLKYIRNIDVIDSRLLIRFSNSFLFYSNNNYSDEENLPDNTKSFTWTDNLAESTNIYHSDYFPKDKILKSTRQFENLLPGELTDNISVARIKNNFFICWKGKLLEYKIYSHYRRILKENSIRHIYKNSSSSIVSSYNGIYFFDNNLYNYRKTLTPSYSNGELNHINSQYYLCSDDLYIRKNDNFTLFWRRDGIEKFREIFIYNGQTYALFEHSFCEIDLKLNREKNKIKIKNLSDVEKFKESLLLSSENGGLYLYKNNKISLVFNCDTGIYDISYYNKSIYICCDDGIRILNNNFKEEKFIKIYKPVNCIPIDNTVITSTYKGLYYIDLIKNSSYELIPDVEFNKKALTRYDNYIYAGSIQGLYIVNIVELSTNFLESLGSNPITTMNYNYVYILIIFTLSIFLILILYYYKRKNKTKISINQKEIFENLNLIYEIIKTNPSIKSVEDLAIYIGVSPPTLITKIKKQTGSSPLIFLKDCKKRIANELINEGFSIEEVAIRIGYSVRYIKNNFLK